MKSLTTNFIEKFGTLSSKVKAGGKTKFLIKVVTTLVINQMIQYPVSSTYKTLFLWLLTLCLCNKLNIHQILIKIHRWITKDWSKTFETFKILHIRLYLMNLIGAYMHFKLKV